MAFEVYTEVPDSDDESEFETSAERSDRPSREASLDHSVTKSFSQLDMKETVMHSPSSKTLDRSREGLEQGPALPPIRTSLSLLEMLLRLLSLQQFQQTPHLSIPDELLTFFLSESASTGAGSNDVQERRRLREEARRHVGFDPYDESPVKIRGEDYQYQGADDSDGWANGNDGYTEERLGSPIGGVRSRYDDEGYNSHTIPRRLGSQPRGNFRDRTPESPLSTSRKHLSGQRSNGSSRSPAGRSSTMGSVGRRFAADGSLEAARRGSPLARPNTRISDEGIGTSPGSHADQEEKGS